MLHTPKRNSEIDMNNVLFSGPQVSLHPGKMISEKMNDMEEFRPVKETFYLSTFMIHT